MKGAGKTRLALSDADGGGNTSKQGEEAATAVQGEEGASGEGCRCSGAGGALLGTRRWEAGAASSPDGTLHRGRGPFLSVSRFTGEKF